MFSGDRHFDSNEAQRKKTSLEQLKNGTSCFEQFLEAVLYKTAVVCLLTSHSTNYPRHSQHCWKYKDSWVTFSFWLLNMDTPVFADQQKFTLSSVLSKGQTKSDGQ